VEQLILICEGRELRDRAHNYDKPATREIQRGYRIRFKTCVTCGVVYSWIDFGHYEE
jgi:hypothetical protein